MRGSMVWLAATVAAMLALPASFAAPAAKLRIAVVPKGTSHEYWKSVHAGAMKAQKEFGDIEVTFRGPDREDDREQQVSLMQNLVSAKYDAIVLAPLDDSALVEPVKDATAAKIPVVIIDSGLKAEAGKDFVSFVATDNYKGGKLAGEQLAKAMGGKGKALLLRYLEGSASTLERERGFIDAIKAHKDIELVDPRRFGGPSRATAQEAAENLLARYSDISGVFACNEPTTFGMLLALRDRGLAGKVKFVGFDSDASFTEALGKNEMDGFVVQSPVRMGYLGVKAAVDHLRGKPVEKNIDTGVTLVTKDNASKPEIKELLAPNLKEMLGEQ